MISQARQGISADYTYDSNPYNKLSEMSELAVKLQTAYILMNRQVYAEKMVQFVRRLLSVEFDTSRLANDFFAGDMAFLLANVYDTCYPILTFEERNEIKDLVIKIFEYYRPLMYGHEENHVFNNLLAVSCKKIYSGPAWCFMIKSRWPKSVWSTCMRCGHVKHRQQTLTEMETGIMEQAILVLMQ